MQAGGGASKSKSTADIQQTVINTADHLSYVMDMIEELQRIADMNGLPVLSRVLSLARIEAQTELELRQK